MHARLGYFDLVMTDRNCRVLIEVRERNNLVYGSAADSVWETKVRPLAVTAERFRQQHQNISSIP